MSMAKRKLTSEQIIFRAVLSAVCVVFVLSAYFAFGFFFDVFAEVSPLLVLAVVLPVVVFSAKKDIGKKFVIAFTCVTLVLSVAAAAATGIIATSIPAYGQTPECGETVTYSYSRGFMKENYDIDQKTVINVWLPDGYDSAKEYPVMYVLDGDNLFTYAAVKAAEHCAAGDGDVIVVGIGYGYWNASFARGGVVWQDEKHLKGRWRDFCFADDTELGYMGDPFGGPSKRGAEFVDFLCNTVVKDVCAKFGVDKSDSTVFGHSLGGGMAAYLLTCYDPALGEENPFNRFVIVDNGYVEYYLRHLSNLEQAMNANGNAPFGNLTVYRIWGGSVNPEDNDEQFALYSMLNEYGWENFFNYFWLPQGANHGDTQTIGIDNALKMILGLDFGCQTSMS